MQQTEKAKALAAYETRKKNPPTRIDNAVIGGRIADVLLLQDVRRPGGRTARFSGHQKNSAAPESTPFPTVLGESL
jgi:hypothetical protein